MRTLRILASLLAVLLLAPGAVADDASTDPDPGLAEWLFEFVEWVACVNNGGGIECDSPPRPRMG